MLLMGALLFTGCSQPAPMVVEGRGVSMRFDPNRVAGLPAAGGPSGPTVTPPSAAGRVANSDDGPIDRLAALAVEDIEEFWKANYGASLPGRFAPVAELISIDPRRDAPAVCGEQPADVDYNAFFCLRDNLIAWDRTDLLPAAEKYFGDMAVSGLLAHEYGHAIQHDSGLTDADTPTLVSEQQADCFAGVYLRWVAAGNSPRFAMNTTDGLDKVLAGAIAVRDRPPSFNPFGLLPVEASHGTALDRVSAFQQGFDLGASACAGIDTTEIERRRGDIPPTLFDPARPVSDLTINSTSLQTLVTVLNSLFTPSHPPTLQMNLSCGPGPATYCPDANTIEVDLPALQQLAAPADENEKVLLQGDNSAISVVTSRYLLAVQHDRGLPVTGETAAMRTVCLTGVAQKLMADPRASGNQLVLGAGDLDKAVSGLLTNGIVATDTSGQGVPSGFTRILAFRSGLAGDAQSCYQRFP